jgi:ribA/ribD-fused uncharacterized protein
MADTIKFISDRDTYGWLSNFHYAPFKYNGRTWKTVEHAYQAAKNGYQEPWLSRIANAKGPHEAKKLGREVSPLLKNWDHVRLDIMTKLVQAKFAAHEDLTEQLLATGEARIEEDAYWDSFWGTGRNGKGRNEMGKILMQLREKLRTSIWSTTHAD